MKHILIIGANSAIAMACARRWAQSPSRFVLMGRDAQRLQAGVDDLRARGAQAEAVPLDVLDTAAQGDALQRAIESLGRIDVMLMAHGTLPDQAQCEREPGQARAAYLTNAVSVIELLLRLAPVMERQGQGTLAVITSVAGDRGRPSNFVYGSAKAAVSTFCEGLRSRLFRHGVHVLDIRPGFVATPMTVGLALPKALVSSPDRAAQGILRAVERRADVAYVPGYWRLILLIVRSIPGVLFKRLSL